MGIRIRTKGDNHMCIELSNKIALGKNNENISDFMPYVNQIRSDDVKTFVTAWLKCMPKYIFHAPASSSGKYHPMSELGEGGLKRHLLNVTEITVMLCEMYDIQNNEKDCVIAAAMLHDMLKSGWQGDYDKNKHTDFNHPRLAAEAIMLTTKPFIPEEKRKLIANCIITHMGRWNKDKYADNPDLPMPGMKLQWLVHTADFIASRKNINIIRED